MAEKFEEINRKKIALLIDGDNAQPSLIKKCWLKRVKMVQ